MTGVRDKWMSFISKAMILCLFSPYFALADVTNSQERLVALIPLANHSGNNHAREVATQQISAGLLENGFRIVDSDSLRVRMRSVRLRLTGEVDSASAELIAENMGSELILTGSVDLYLEYENPEVGVSLRAYDCRSHSVLWAASEYATGEDGVGLFGVGRITDIDKLMHKVVMKLLNGFAGDLASPTSLLKENTTRQAGQESISIAVIPFDNSTEFTSAGAIASNVLLQDLWKRGYDLLEPGELTKVKSTLSIDLSGGITDSVLDVLSSRHGIDAVVTGTVSEFSPVRSAETDDSPEVEFTMRYISTSTKQVGAAIMVGADGSKSESLFGLGKVYSIGELTKRVFNNNWDELLKRKNSKTAAELIGRAGNEDKNAVK